MMTVNTENDQEAGQSDGFDDLFADNESESMMTSASMIR